MASRFATVGEELIVAVNGAAAPKREHQEGRKSWLSDFKLYGF